MTKDRSNEALEGEIRIGWRMMGLGMEVASQVAAGAILGWAFDLWQETAPTGLLVGAITGIVVGLWSMIRGGLKLNRMLDEKYPTAGRGKTLPDDEPEDESDESDDFDNGAPLP